MYRSSGACFGVRLAGGLRYENIQLDGGDFTTQSNADFDAQLRARDPQSGIRDFEVLDDLAYGQGLTLAADNAMPANNRLLIWQRGAS